MTPTPEPTAGEGRTLAVIALGGVIGSELRYVVGMLVGAGGLGWATVAVNVTGGFGMGLLAALLTRARRPLWRPFLATGVLGGFTTFSTFSTDTLRLVESGRPWSSLGYVLLTLALVLPLTYAGDRVGSWLVSRSVGGP